MDREILVKWRDGHQAWLGLIDFLRLHRLFTAPWYLVLLFLFMVSLGFSTLDQFGISFGKTFASVSGPRATNESNSFTVALSKQDLTKRLRRQGYIKVGNNSDAVRYVKHPWGYWGIFLLHLGLLIVVASSLLVTATRKQGVIRLAEGEIHRPAQPWLYEEHGLFVAPLKLPESVRLLRLTPEYGKDDNLKKLQSAVNFVSAQGLVNQQVIATDSILNYQGLRIYQKADFGNDFHLIFSARGERKGRAVIDLVAPLAKDKASYGDFDFVGLPYHLMAKYYADAEKKSLLSDNPLLTIRLLDKDRIVGELSLTSGARGKLGPYQVQLAKVKRWTYFIFIDTCGMNGVFLGFFIIILGGMLGYFTIPRELYGMRKNDGSLRMFWRVTKFNSLYQHEFEMIKSMLIMLEDKKTNG